IVVGVSLITARCAGDTADFGVMVRAGALARGMVAAGEWWRLISCVFVHAGATHLAVNAIGLVVLGLLVEDVFGAARMVAIFAVAGVSGAVASYLAAPVGISAGSSGAVFGLLAALLVEMTWHRRYYPLAWKRGLWGALIVVAVAELGFGYLSDMTDQWAHGGGLFAGAVMGAALSPTARWMRIGSAAGRAIAIGFGALAVVAGILAARTSLADSLARGGFARRTVAGVALHVPVGWEAWTGMEIESSRVRLVGLVSEPDGAIGMILEPGRRTAPSDLVEHLLARQAQRAKDAANPAPPDELDLGRIEPASEPLIALPPGWDGSELITMHRDSIDYDQRGRAVLCRRVLGDQSIFVIIQVPETIASAAPEFVALLLASIGPA
ncbi:MAG TPA: rhomboid family intramembrane serine protease, partial [Kofleriaceae bacterium]|nr:rhomboid family intramembrane serine protease [Kofleriaceae bacterium]